MISRAVALLLLLSIIAVMSCCKAQQPEDPLEPPDDCGVYGGNNSTCHCSSTKRKAWVTFGLVLFFTPVATFAVMRWFVFTDVTMPFLGLFATHLTGSYDRDANSMLWWSAVFWTALASVVAWLIIAIRYALDLWSNDIQLCPNLNRFSWHLWLFWVIPLAIAIACSFLRKVYFMGGIVAIE
jgi:hypothetical protein